MDCGLYQSFVSWTLDSDRDAHKFTLSKALKDIRYLESQANSVHLAKRRATQSKMHSP